MFAAQISVVVFAAFLVCKVTGTALDDYVARPDAVFDYQELSDYNFRDEEWGVTVYILNMTSQQWKTDAVSDTSIWFHYMAIVVPDELDYTNSSGIFISLGNNSDDPPSADNDILLQLVIETANTTRGIVTLLNQIPNQPIVYATDPTEKPRSEDDSIAYTWRRFIVEENAADPEILLPFPMAKAVVRAMDVVQDFGKTKLGYDLDGFILAGPSKRGWATYLAAISDPERRVIGIIPMVFSVLNMQENLHRHFQSLGGWSFAFEPYWKQGIAPHLDSENSLKVYQHLDPLAYKDKLTMPMYVVQASGDEFFHIDEPNLWWRNLTNQRHLLMLQNSNHIMVGHYDRLINNFAAFTSAIIEDFKMPELSWELSQTEGKGKIVLQTDTTPLEIFSYWANTTIGPRRDFRLLVRGDNETVDLNPVFWEEGPVIELGDGMYEAEYDEPEQGWKGFFIYMKFAGPRGREFEFTTEANIIPNTFPYPRCSGNGCIGSIV